MRKDLKLQQLLQFIEALKNLKTVIGVNENWLLLEQLQK
jgi:hypothetical protein